jgi:hypothetical protein
MPLHYNGLGVSVMYPDGWKIEEDGIEENSVSFESPLGAFLTITRYPELNFSDAVEKAHQVMLAEYDEVESEDLQRTIADREFNVTALRFVYLDFLIVAELFSFLLSGSTYLVQIQGEDRDVEKLQPVFQAMLTSLFQKADNRTIPEEINQGPS